MLGAWREAAAEEGAEIAGLSCVAGWGQRPAQGAPRMGFRVGTSEDAALMLASSAPCRGLTGRSASPGEQGTGVQAQAPPAYRVHPPSPPVG